MLLFRKVNLFIPFLLLAVTLLAYGLLIPWLGFYSDDWLFLWIGQKMGGSGMTRYFSTNRPVWGLLYQITMPLFGSSPIGWHIFALLVRWINAVVAWELISLAWPGERRRIALWAALLLLVYPGYKLQPIAITFGHIFLVLTIFFASLACSLLAARRPDRTLPFTAVGLFLSLLNLLMMEYFFVLELLRPLLIFLATTNGSLRNRIWATIRRWLPYLAVFLLVLIWRTFFFQYQTHNYDLIFVEQLSVSPFSALIDLLSAFARNIFVVFFRGWGNAFTEIPVYGVSQHNRFGWALLAIIATLAAYAGFALLRRPANNNVDGASSASSSTLKSIAVFSLAWLALAGAPFLLTGLRVEADWIYSRFTIPYIFGAALLIAVFLAWLQQKLLRNNAWIPALTISILVGLSTGSQFLNANRFRADWSSQRDLYWQMAWRMPALQPGTTLLINEQNSYAGSPTFLTAAANWFYAPTESGTRVFYQVLFTREALVSAHSSGNLDVNYLGGVYTGGTQDVVTLSYKGHCLRVLDPQIDEADPTLDDYSIRASLLSHPERITAEDVKEAGIHHFVVDPVILGREPARDWCYWSAQADLARQQNDWQAVVEIGDAQINEANLIYKTVGTYLPFIEGYAQQNRWETALTLSEQINQVVVDQHQLLDDKNAAPLLCRIWQRIEAQTPDSAEKTAALEQVRQQYACGH
jgi:hypothetical protein